MSENIKIKQRSVPLLNLEVTALNGVGEERSYHTAISVRRTEDGQLLIPLDSSFASFADADLLRRIADALEAGDVETEPTKEELAGASAGSDS